MEYFDEEGCMPGENSEIRFWDGPGDSSAVSCYGWIVLDAVISRKRMANFSYDVYIEPRPSNFRMQMQHLDLAHLR